jgi:hypothetical protein
MMAQRWGEYLNRTCTEARGLMFPTIATIVLARVSMRGKMDFSPQYLRLHIFRNDQYKMSYPVLS